MSYQFTTPSSDGSRLMKLVERVDQLERELAAMKALAGTYWEIADVTAYTAGSTVTVQMQQSGVSKTVRFIDESGVNPAVGDDVVVFFGPFGAFATSKLR